MISIERCLSKGTIKLKDSTGSIEEDLRNVHKYGTTTKQLHNECFPRKYKCLIIKIKIKFYLHLNWYLKIDI